MGRTTVAEGIPTTIKTAAVLGGILGAITVLATPPLLLELQRTGELPVIFGARAFGGGAFEGMPTPTLVALGRAFVGLNVLELIAARWLWQGRRRGGWLVVLLTLGGAPFWVGSGLPHWLIVGLLRVVLSWRGWASLHRTNRPCVAPNPGHQRPEGLDRELSARWLRRLNEGCEGRQVTADLRFG